MTFTIAGWGVFSESIHITILTILLLIALIQWIILFPLARKYSLLHTLDHIQDEQIQQTEEKKSFFTDIWFILWNLFPFAIGLFCIFVSHNWNYWLAALNVVLVPDILAVVTEIDQLWSQSWISFGLLFLSAGSVWSQFTKQRRFIDGEKK